MADLNPNEEELLILPDDDETISNGSQTSDSSDNGTSSDGDVSKTEPEKAEAEELISFDDVETAHEDPASKLELLDEKTSVETEQDSKSEIDLSIESTSNTTDEFSPELLDFTIDEQTEASESESVETKKSVGMSSLLGDEGKVETIEDVESQQDIDTTSDLLSGLGSNEDIKVNESANMVAVGSAVTTGVSHNAIGTMEEILEDTVGEFEQREQVIQADLDTRTSHIKELEDELKLEKIEVAELEGEQKKLKTNKQKILDMIKTALGKTAPKTTRKTSSKK